MLRAWRFIGSVFLLSSFYSREALGAVAGTETCEASEKDSLDWYRQYSGETPCKTYERLRQICTPDFRVTTLSTQLPPDVCRESDPAKSDCCCNTVAFALSMMCLACQQGGGKDARNGTYQLYLSGGIQDAPWCPTVHNRTLPAAVQTSVCQQGIRIFDLIYRITWLNDGAWFFGYVRDQIVKAMKNATDESRDPAKELFQICPEGSAITSGSNSASGTGALPTGTQSSDSNSASNEKKGMEAGAIAGIAVGIAIVIAAIIAGITFYCIHTSKTRTTKPKAPDVQPYTFHELPSEPRFAGINDTVLHPNRYQVEPVPFVSSKPPKPRHVQNHSPTETSRVSSAPSSSASGNRSGSGSGSGSTGENRRHADGGPVFPSGLNRTESGRLPPAYGDLPTR
ncbi:hypothetical protein PQX77_005902 [Marasmius sp. AFHP31]|nr:hypothetical protein PQX77_005902 [Marasmius sp. AFHP31]